MADITPPYTFVAGSVAAAVEAAEMLHFPKSVDDSFAVLHGGLTDANRDAGWSTISRYAVRPGAISNGRMVVTTINKDIFRDWFFGADGPYGKSIDIDSEESFNARALSVAGLSIPVDLPFRPRGVRIFWHWSQVTYNGYDVDTVAVPATEEYRTKGRLWVDGVPIYPTTVGLKDGTKSMVYQPSTQTTSEDLFAPDARFVTGALILDEDMVADASLNPGSVDFLAPGRHQVEMRLGHDALHVRAQTARIGYMYFR